VLQIKDEDIMIKQDDEVSFENVEPGLMLPVIVSSNQKDIKFSILNMIVRKFQLDCDRDPLYSHYHVV